MENNTIKDLHARIISVIKRLNAINEDLTGLLDEVTSLTRQCLILEENLFDMTMDALEYHLNNKE